MFSILKWLGFAIAIIVFCLGLYFFGVLSSTGQFAKIEPHFNGKCNRIDGVVGAEDIEVDSAQGLIFLSSLDRRNLLSGADVQGAIYGLALNDLDTKPTKIETKITDKFHPHGMSIYRDGGRLARLFVINHPTLETTTVEIFDINQGGKLTHIRTIKGFAELISGNDIIAVGPDQFYMTNDAGQSGSRLKALENYFRIPSASIAYFDGKTMRTVADGLIYANGINVSQDKELLYVSEFLNQKIQIYKRDLTNGSLRRIATIGLKTHLDNIHVDNDDNLWVGAHPKLLELLSHARNGENISPSQVLKISFGVNNEAIVDEVYLNDGTMLSGSSVAVPIGNKLLIGSVFEPYILICQMN